MTQNEIEDDDQSKQEEPAPLQKTSRKQQHRREKAANRARHRLWSIQYDVQHSLKPFLEQHSCSSKASARHNVIDKFPLVANERCGSWYAYPLLTQKERQGLQPSKLLSSSCYFKSTDGHTGTWNFSLKRLNLGLLDVIDEFGGCIVVDASVRKEMPDSFSKTIPIWACVLNNMAFQLHRPDHGNNDFDKQLHVPNWIVNDKERRIIEDKLEVHVQTLRSSRALVDPEKLARVLRKPLRPYWVRPQISSSSLPGLFQRVDPEIDADKYFPLVLLSCSEYDPTRSRRIKTDPKSGRQMWYTPGAADDHESWGRGLVPRLWWENMESLSRIDNDDDFDAAVDQIVHDDKQTNETPELTELHHQATTWDAIGGLGVSIGTRRAGRPPECWHHFDAVLNVTNLEYDDMVDGAEFHDKNKDGNFYLQMPVEEGKRDRSELERWLACGIVFILFHAVIHKRKVLVHCAQGKDRSAAVCIATVILGCCGLEYPLGWNTSVETALKKLMLRTNETSRKTIRSKPYEVDSATIYKRSGLSSSLVDTLLGRKGRDLLLQWAKVELGWSGATKESLRMALHLVKQDREVADPTRSTMQKLNRFFMSAKYESSGGDAHQDLRSNPM